MMDVDVSLRTNIDYIFTMREVILTNRQKLYKYYFGQFKKFDDFERVMQACTQNYKALVLDGTISSTEPTDSVRWYKADPNLPPFTLCKPIFWKLSRKFELSADAVRRAKERQFEADSVKEAGGAGSRFALVQTEDENGALVSC